MFLGRYHHALDTKGRVAVPARYRTGLGDGGVLTRGADRSLALYPANTWSALCTRISELPVSDPDARAFRRFVFGEAVDVEFDSQGRILVPQILREFGGIERTIVFVGLDTMIEVWSESAWTAISSELDRQADQIIARLGTML